MLPRTHPLPEPGRRGGESLVLSLAPLLQLSRYSLVSLIALSLDFALYLVLTRAAMAPALAGAIAYSLAMVLHYALSIAFVFTGPRRGKTQARQFAEFALSGLIGVVITLIVIGTLTEVAGLSPVPAKVIATATSFLAVFALRRRVVFADGFSPQGLSG